MLMRSGTRGDNARDNYIPFLNVDSLETCKGYCSERLGIFEGGAAEPSGRDRCRVSEPRGISCCSLSTPPLEARHEPRKFLSCSWT